MFTESLPPNSRYHGMLAALAGSLTATTTLGGIVTAYRTSTSLVEDLLESKYVYRTSTSRDLSKLLQIANYTCRTSIPAFTSICRALNMLAGPLQAFASPCGTLTALAEPIAAFMTHCGI